MNLGKDALLLESGHNEGMLVFEGDEEEKIIVFQSAPYSRITDVGAFIEHELLQKKKSAVSRTIVGWLLLGDIGAVLGYIDSTTPKEKQLTKYFMFVNYLNANDEIAVLSFRINSNVSWNDSRFTTNLRSRIYYAKK